MWFQRFLKKASYLPRVFFCWEFSGNMLRTKTPLKPFPALSVDIAISLNKLDLGLHVLQGFSHSEMALWGQFYLSWSFSSGHISEMFHIDFGSISRLFDSGAITIEWLGVTWRIKFPNWIHCRIIVSVKETNQNAECFSLHKLETVKHTTCNITYGNYPKPLSLIYLDQRGIGEAEGKELAVLMGETESESPKPWTGSNECL